MTGHCYRACTSPIEKGIPKTRIDSTDIMKAVCKHFGNTSPKVFWSKGKSPSEMHRRRVAIYLLRTDGWLNDADTGTAAAGRDYQSIASAVDTVEKNSHLYANDICAIRALYGKV